MPTELRNVDNNESQPPISGLGWSIVATTSDTPPSVVLAKCITAWRAVVSWGRWCDDELGEWPSLAHFVSSMPQWLQISLNDLPEYELINWADDIYNRSWSWWRGHVLPVNLIKIDLKAESLPVSVWPIEYVVKQSGGWILYSDMPIADEEAIFLSERK